MDNQLFLQGHSQLDPLPEISTFCQGSFSDYDSSDTSSPCSSNADGLDFLSFDVPEIFFPQDFDLASMQPGVNIPDADQGFCSLDEHLHSITPTQNANKCANDLEEYISTTPPPSCMMDNQLPHCSVQSDMPPSIGPPASLCHHQGGDLNVSAMHGGLIQMNDATTAPPDARMNNNMNNEESNAKPRNNSLPHTNEKSKKTRATAKTLRKHSIPDQMKDEKYWRRRLRNNWSAKKSREAKRAKDRLIHNKISFLESENNNLKMIVTRLLAEKNSHRCNAPAPQWNNQIM